MLLGTHRSKGGRAEMLIKMHCIFITSFLFFFKSIFVPASLYIKLTVTVLILVAVSCKKLLTKICDKPIRMLQLVLQK